MDMPWKDFFRKPAVWLPRVAALVGLAYIMAILGRALAETIASGLDFSCPFANGCFQLYNPLRRLAAGQIAGHDFQFFYGLGSLLIHYPFFRLFGGNLLASEIAKNALAPLVFISASYFLLRTVVRRRDISLFLTGCVCMAAANLFPGLLFPVNSLITVRTALPVLMAAILYVAVSERQKAGGAEQRWGRAAIPLAAMSGLAIFVSPDQGLLASAALAIVWCIGFGCGRQARLGLMAWAVLTVLVAIASHMAVAGRYWLEPIVYHLQEMPSDQMWYFGTPPNLFLDSWSRVGDWLFRKPNYLLAASILGLCAVFRRQLGRPTAVLAVYLTTYGLFSTVSGLGYLKAGYLYGLSWCLTLAILIMSWSLLAKPKSSTRLIPRSWLLMLLGLLTTLMAFDAFSASRLAVEIIKEKTDRPCAKSTLGVILNPDWAHHQQMMRPYVPDKPGEMWSTYSSLVEAENQLFHPAGVDYIIHALGNRRRQEYLDAFDRSQPALVRTMTYRWRYEPWLWNTHWDFYQRLLRNYRLADSDDLGAAWIRRDSEWQTPENDARPWQPLTVAESGELELPIDEATRPRLLTLRLGYEIDNPWEWLPIIGLTPRYLLLSENAGLIYRPSLSPHSQSVDLPIRLVPGAADARIWPETVSLWPGPSFRITSAQWREEPLDAAATAHFFPKPEDTVYWQDITDWRD